MKIYFKTRKASREFAAKVKANGKLASVVDAGKGWGMLRYGVALAGGKAPANCVDKRIAYVK